MYDIDGIFEEDCKDDVNVNDTHNDVNDTDTINAVNNYSSDSDSSDSASDIHNSEYDPARVSFINTSEKYLLEAVDDEDSDEDESRVHSEINYCEVQFPLIITPPY
nr:unnamed protein product [Callosobruchus analis]